MLEILTAKSYRGFFPPYGLDGAADLSSAMLE